MDIPGLVSSLVSSPTQVAATALGGGASILTLPEQQKSTIKASANNGTSYETGGITKRDQQDLDGFLDKQSSMQTLQQEMSLRTTLLRILHDIKMKIIDNFR